MLISVQDCADLLAVVATDTLLVRLAAATDAWIKAELSRQFERKVRIEFARGFGHGYIVLKESPIRAISELRIDQAGLFQTSSIVTDLTVFTYDSEPAHDDSRVFYTGSPTTTQPGFGFLSTGYTRFPAGFRVVQLTYEAGWWPPASGTLLSLSSVGTLATAATAAAHGLQNGQTVLISAASPAAYNGAYTITVTDTTHFTYVFAGGTSPATGAILFAGTSDVPADLSDRLIERVAARYKQGADEEMKDEHQGDRSWAKFAETDARILAALHRYRRVTLF